LRSSVDQEWKKGSKDLERIGMLLERLKLSLTQLAFLPTKGDEASLQVRLKIILFGSVGDP
jgi:hypothetical protein